MFQNIYPNDLLSRNNSIIEFVVILFFINVAIIVTQKDFNTIKTNECMTFIYKWSCKSILIKKSLINFCLHENTIKKIKSTTGIIKHNLIYKKKRSY